MLTSLKSFLTGCICSPPLFLSGQVWRFPKSDRWGAILLSQPTGANAAWSAQLPAPPWVAVSSSALQPRLFQIEQKKEKCKYALCGTSPHSCGAPKYSLGEMRRCKAWKEPPALSAGSSHLHPYHVTSSWGGPGALPASLVGWQPHGRSENLLPSHRTHLQHPSPTSGAGTVQAGHLLLSPHATQARLITRTLRKQEPAFSTPKLKST